MNSRSSLFLALLLQVVIMGTTFFGDYTRPLSVAAGCAVGTVGLLISILRNQLHDPR